MDSPGNHDGDEGCDIQTFHVTSCTWHLVLWVSMAWQIGETAQNRNQPQHHSQVGNVD